MTHCTASSNEKPRVHATMVFPLKGNTVYMARRKVSPFLGSYGGYGGKLDLGESPVQAAIREWNEETNTELHREHLEWLGVMDTERLLPEGRATFRVHLFVTTVWKGDIVETPEMGPPEPIPLDALTSFELRPEMYEALRHIPKRILHEGILILVKDNEDGYSTVQTEPIKPNAIG